MTRYYAIRLRVVTPTDKAVLRAFFGLETGKQYNAKCRELNSDPVTNIRFEREDRCEAIRRKMPNAEWFETVEYDSI